MTEQSNDVAAVVTDTGKHVVDQIASGNANELLEAAMPYLINLAAAIAIFVVGRIVAGAVRGIVRNVLTKRNVDATIVGFVAGLLHAVLMIGVVLAALQRVGVQTTSFVAIIGAAGLAIALSLQGSLSNFASGFLLVIFRPFKAGDVIDAGGATGKVEEIGIFNTTLLTPDNRVIIVPNSSITGGNITNISAKDTRRIDLTVGVSYDDDLKGVKATLEAILNEDERILQDPAYTVAVAELADSSVNFVVRPWVKAADYWDVFFHLNETMKVRLEEAGYSIPYPQQDVHMHQK